MNARVLIAGGGTSAAAVAKGLREHAFAGLVEMLAGEPELPYERPPLSKAYLRGDRDKVSLGVLPADWYSDNDVTIHRGVTASRIDVGAHRVLTRTGEWLSYSQLVIATGGRPRRLDLDLPEERTFYLRSVGDADRLRSALLPGTRLAVIGAGFIGCELAATARTLGVEVTVIEALEVPLLRVLGRELGALYTELHREKGVQVTTNASVSGVVAGKEDVVLRLDDGTTVECDVVAVGVGMVPNMELAIEAGIECRNGVMVNEFGQTSATDVLAAGDVAEHYHPLFDAWLRVEHHDNALKQGASVAATIAGQPAAYCDPHWFWSDQYEYNLQSIGIPQLGDAVVMRGRLENRAFTAFYLRHGVLVGAIGVNSGTDVRRAGRLISQRQPVTAGELSDPGVDLRRLLTRTGRPLER
jgi:3-phenylpropionate/trans-cinnamate dioxygenase ferredoxin reductase component